MLPQNFFDIGLDFEFILNWFNSFFTIIGSKEFVWRLRSKNDFHGIVNLFFLKKVGQIEAFYVINLVII
jgi:hypothetical protein